MPFCPKCRQEYQAGVDECADCMVPLADSLEGAGEQDPSQSFIVFRAQDGAVLDLMQRAVAVHHIPTQLTDEVPALGMKGHLLVVPAEMGERASRVLEQGIPTLIGEGEGNDRIYRFYQEGEEEEIRGPELLEESVSELVEQGPEIMDELIELVARGDKNARHRAAYVLSCMGEEGVLALLKLLKVAIEKKQAQVAVSLIRVFRNEVEIVYGWEEICDYLTGAPESKNLALQALAAFNYLEAIPRIIPLLEDPEPAIRDEADNTLCTLADEDMGFDTQASEEERAQVIQKWQDWWSRKHG